MAPFKTAEEFDNVGLLVGDLDSAVSGGVVCLDVTAEVVETAIKKKAELIISHHPIIFNPLKKISNKSLIGKLLKNKISVISAHTNLDKAEKGVNFFLANALKLLNVKVLEQSMGYGRIGELKESLSFLEFLKYVSKKLKTLVKAVKTSKQIKKVAVVSGSGYFALDAAMKARADALITGESKHNVLIEAHEKNFCFVDASHFATENVFCEPLVEILNERFKKDGVSFFKTIQKNPAVFAFGEDIWG